MGESKKLIKGNARKKNYKNKNNKHNKNLVSNKKTKINKNIQKGGGKRDNFEVTAWDDIDFDKISLTKNADINWGDSAFGLMAPPTDCTLM